MRILVLFLLVINLYAENNYKLILNTIDDLYIECVEETDKVESCQAIEVSNYILFFNYLKYKTDSSKEIDDIYTLEHKAQKEYLTKEINSLLNIYDKDRKKSISSDIEYTTILNKEFLDDYNDFFEECIDTQDEHLCIQKIESKEQKDIEELMSSIKQELSDKELSLEHEHKEWIEYQSFYSELLKNNYENDIASEVYEGSMWNSVKADHYSRTITQRRAKLKSLLLHLKKKSS
jgi:hypothetical protein